ncbi:MAG TPA: xanthine dehydrogenase family protein subunit M [Gemmatimonadaceae bacterium]|nr:xanthine dehydrogenase family protein subunit M [Gemmatimonadaceae bacterium]
MYPASFEYHRAESIEDAAALLAKYGDEAKLLAGGHSLLPLLKLRFTTPGHLIDVRRIPALTGIRQDAGTIAIGAAATHNMVAQSTVVRGALPLLSEAASEIGDPQVRNMGTIGGSLAHCDPAADLPAVVLALGAELVAVGPRGRRVIAADDFFVGICTTALGAREILTEVRIPVPAKGTGGAYAKHPHPASRYALAGVAAVVAIAGGKCSRASVASTGLSSHARRERAVEEALVGKAPDDAALAAAAAAVASGLTLRSDLQGPAEYKRALAVACARRALATAVARARG